MKEFEFIPNSTDASKAIAEQFIKVAKSKINGGSNTYEVEVLAKKIAAEFHKNIINDVQNILKQMQEVDITV